MLLVPMARLEVVSVAWPAFNVPLPIEVDPLRNVTVPVDCGEFTDAVKVIVWLGAAGFGEDCNEVAELAALTACDKDTVCA